MCVQAEDAPAPQPTVVKNAKPQPSEFIDPRSIGGGHTVFPKGRLRKVHVIRQAVAANMRTGKNHPTMVVVEEGKPHLFHKVSVFGSVGRATVFMFDRLDKDANVYAETNEEIIGFVDAVGDPPFVLPPTRGQVFMFGLKNLLRRVVGGTGHGLYVTASYIPIFRCLVVDHD